MSWNFALILFILLLITGVIWGLDVAVWRRRRRQRVADVMAHYDAIAAGPAEVIAQERERALEEARHVPWWIEYGVSFFPVILFVFVLRSFVVEPFRIPSGSMLPTLQSGDLILVKKYSYGIRLPVIDRKVIETGQPERGDVVVFRYPVEPEVDYIKRVVGLPGDEVAYLDKRLFVNGQEVKHERADEYFEPDRMLYTTRYKEHLGDVDHSILLDERNYQALGPITNFPFRDQCEYARNGVRCTVPEGHYFVMGDNRDNSQDSRYWGFVPDQNIVGKAFFIWMNFSDLGRIGRFD